MADTTEYPDWNLGDIHLLRTYRGMGKSWEEISLLMPGRTPGACATRYYSSKKGLVKSEVYRRPRPPRRPRQGGRPRTRGDDEPLPSADEQLRVPEGDPLLARLVAAHGGDESRDIDEKSGVPLGAACFNIDRWGY